MSGDRISPKFEMIATTRRRWSRQQKLAILAEVDAPGGSVSEVARRHNLHTSLLFRWRRDLGTPIGEPPPIAAPPSFMPVMLPSPSPQATSAPARPRGNTSSAIEITITGGRTVRVGSAPAGGVGAIMVRALRLGRQAAGMALLLTCGSSQRPARVSRLM